MIVTAYHDDAGNIVALVARPDDAPASHRASQFALRSTEVQEPALTDDLQPSEINRRLAELKSSRRVAVDAGTGRLVER
jgi:hypothetical protein